MHYMRPIIHTDGLTFYTVKAQLAANVVLLYVCMIRSLFIFGLYSIDLTAGDYCSGFW